MGAGVLFPVSRGEVPTGRSQLSAGGWSLTKRGVWGAAVAARLAVVAPVGAWRARAGFGSAEPTGQDAARAAVRRGGTGRGAVLQAEGPCILRQLSPACCCTAGGGEGPAGSARACRAELWWMEL